MRTSPLAAVVVCAGLLALGAPVAAESPAPPGLATPVLVRYEDPTGDQAGGDGPDIIAVTLSAPDAATLRIAIQFAEEPPLAYDLDAGWTDMLMLLGSTSSRGVIAVPGGGDGVDADFVVGLHGATLADSVEHGGQLLIGDDLSMHGIPVTLDGSTITLSLSRDRLGDPDQILFFMGVAREGGAGDPAVTTDVFPDHPADGPYTQVAWRFPDA